MSVDYAMDILQALQVQFSIHVYTYSVPTYISIVADTVEMQWSIQWSLISYFHVVFGIVVFIDLGLFVHSAFRKSL